MPISISKSFKAPLDRTGDRLNWVIMSVPLDVQKVWGKRGQLKVKGELRAFPDGKGHGEPWTGCGQQRILRRRGARRGFPPVF